MDDKLQKLLAHAGHGSRREIETWISDGRITVNGKRAKLGERASANDRILLDGKLVSLSSRHSESIKALIYHKPEGEICTRKDPAGRPTVFENLPAIMNGRWVSVGRLDINTSGLLLFTNNGELANKLMHPSTGLEREYLVRVRGRASDKTLEQLTRKGVDIDGKPAKFESVLAADMAEEGTNHWYRVIIKEGRNREVRRMWDAVGHTVSRLKRVRYGTIKLTRDLKRGKVSKMAPKQLEKMVTAVGLQDEFSHQLYSSGRDGNAKSGNKPKPSPKFASQQQEKNTRVSGKKKAKRTTNRVTKRTTKRNAGRDASYFEKTMESGSGSAKRASGKAYKKKTSNKKVTRKRSS